MAAMCRGSLALELEEVLLLGVLEKKVQVSKQYGQK